METKYAALQAHRSQFRDKGRTLAAFVRTNELFGDFFRLMAVDLDGAPQDELTSFLGGDLVVNVFNDDRQSRLYLKDEALELVLKDPDNNVVDTAGDGGPAFAGGRRGTWSARCSGPWSRATAPCRGSGPRRRSPRAGRT